MKAGQVLKIMNARHLMTIAEIREWLSKIANDGTVIKRDCDEIVKAAIFNPIDDDKILRNAPKMSRKTVYYLIPCGCEYDCCGCHCGTTVNAYKNGDFLTVIGSFRYNY